MRNMTDMIMLLDRSGSMGSVQEAMEGTLNKFITEQKSRPEPCTFTLVKFDDQYETAITTTPISNVGHISLEPRGWTRLLDAVGRAIDETGKRFSDMAEQIRPNKVLFIIITDGLENDSREFNRQQVFDKITRQRDVYKWEFVFLGADQDAIASASNIGIDASNVLNYSNTKRSVGGMGKKMSDSVTKYRGGGAAVTQQFFGAEQTVTEEDMTAAEQQDASK